MTKRLAAPQRAERIQTAKQLHQQGLTQREVAAALGVSQPTVCQWLQALPTVQQRAAQKIREELVCCDIYQRFMDLDDAVRQKELRHSSDYHDICFYGEWAARIAEQMP